MPLVSAPSKVSVLVTTLLCSAMAGVIPALCPPVLAQAAGAPPAGVPKDMPGAGQAPDIAPADDAPAGQPPAEETTPDEAAPGGATPGGVTPDGTATGQGNANGEGNTTTGGNTVTGPQLTLPVSSQVWSTSRGNLQRTGASTAKLSLPLNLWWRHTSDAIPGTFTSSPVVTGRPGLRRVMFAADKYVYCVDAQNGSQIWRTDITGSVKGPLTLVSGAEGGDMLIAATTGGLIWSLNPVDGSQWWTVDANATVQSVAPVLANTPHGQRLVLGLGSGHFIAIGADGKLDNSFDLKFGRAGTIPASTPLINTAGTRLYVIGRDQILYSVDLSDLSIDFQVPLRASATIPPALLGGMIVVSLDNRLLGIDATDGGIAWQVNLDSRILTSPSGMSEKSGSGVAYLGTVKGSLIAVDLSDGTILWTANLEASVSGTPTVLNDMVIVGTRNGLLCAVKRTDGTILWRYRLHSERLVQVMERVPTGGGIPGRNTAPQEQKVTTLKTYGVSSPPAIVDGQLYVLADNASLYAFSNESLDAEPPRLLNPTLSIRNSGGTLTPLPLSNGITIPGRSPISFSVEVDDLGSGVDPAGFQVTLNGNDIEAANVFYQPATSKLTAVLAQNIDTKPTVLEDGLYRIGIIARDYRGNIVTDTKSFTVDKTAQAPAAPVINRGGNGPRGGRGGGRG